MSTLQQSNTNNNNKPNPNTIPSSGKLCTICSLILSRNNYSIKQWNNKAKTRKCINCINNNKRVVDTSNESPLTSRHGLSAIVLNTPSAINTRTLANINNDSNNNNCSILPNNLTEQSIYCTKCAKLINNNNNGTDDNDSDVSSNSSSHDIIAQMYSNQDSETVKAALVDSLHNIFRTVDSNRDGLINKQQFKDFLGVLGLDESREHALLSLVSDDSDGITYQQFLKRFEGGLETNELDLQSAGLIEGLQDKEIELELKQREPNNPDVNSNSNTNLHRADLQLSSGFSSSSNTAIPSSATSPTHHLSQLSSTINNNNINNIIHMPNPNLICAINDPNRSHRGSLKVNNKSLTIDASSPRLTNIGSGSGPSPNTSPRAMKPISVFLGGACGATTWRTRIAIPKLQSYNISYYNPQVQDWHPHLVCLENLMKAWCKILLFVVGKSTRSLVSMIEAASLISSGRKVVLVIKEITADTMVEGQKVTSSEAKDLNRARHYLKDIAQTYHIQVYNNVSDACDFIINEIRQDRKQKANEKKHKQSHTPSKHHYHHNSNNIATLSHSNSIHSINNNNSNNNNNDTSTSSTPHISTPHHANNNTNNNPDGLLLLASRHRRSGSATLSDIAKRRSNSLSNPAINNNNTSNNNTNNVQQEDD